VIRDFSENRLGTFSNVGALRAMSAIRRKCLVIGLLIAATADFTYAAKPKGASLTLRTRFNATSYLLEAVEFLVRKYC
jgi:hypothetical protein